MIYMSIHPKPSSLILKQRKNHEFRNYIPKNPFCFIAVYTSYPICAIEYILEIEKIVAYPDKIYTEGIGNTEFNDGHMTKYAYEIKHVYVLETPLPLQTLQQVYHFHPPQAYAYAKTYEMLSKDLKQIPTHKLY